MARTITASRRSAVKAPAKKKVVKKTATKPAKVVKVQPKKALKKPATQKKVAKAAPKKTIPKAPKKEKAPKATTGPKGYTADEYAKFKDFQATFSKKSNQELKDLLRKNLQSMSGNKDELIYKCADGATLGRIPRCPTCFGGRYLYCYSGRSSTTRRELTTVRVTEMILTSTTATQPSARPRSPVILGTIDPDCNLVIFFKQSQTNLIKFMNT